MLYVSASADQLGKELGEFGDIFQPLGHGVDSVEVAADPYVIDSGYVADVLDVIGHIPQRVLQFAVAAL